MLDLNAVEAVWVALNLTAVVLTISALTDAWADRTAVRMLNGHARELTADGIVRREGLRLVVQALLLIAVLPGAFKPGEPALSLTVVALMAVPVTLVVSSIFDSRERRRSTIMVAADILAERSSAISRLEAAVAENTDLTVQAGKRADQAYREANATNGEVATQGAAIIDKAKFQEDAVARMETTVEHTAGQVEEIHDATVGKS